MGCAGVALFGRPRRPCQSTSKPLHRPCPARFKLVIHGNGFRPRDALDGTIATIDSDRIRFGRRQISGTEEILYLHHSPCRLPYPLSGLKPSVHFYPLGNGITVIRIAIRALEIFRTFYLQLLQQLDANQKTTRAHFTVWMTRECVSFGEYCWQEASMGTATARLIDGWLSSQALAR